jgi:uncharacterized membrane protein YheB (UPF0754 family)
VTGVKAIDPDSISQVRWPMRNPAPFDTHAFVKRLMAAGIPEAQAEAHVENLAEAIALLVFKDDLKRAVEQIEFKLGLPEQKMEQRFTLSDQKLEQRMAQSELKMTIRVGVIVAAAVGILATILRLYLVR